MRKKRVKTETLPASGEGNIQLYPIWEVAMIFNVTERTVHNWLDHGKLMSIRTPGNQIRITKASVDAWRCKIDERNN